MQQKTEALSQNGSGAQSPTSSSPSASSSINSYISSPGKLLESKRRQNYEGIRSVPSSSPDMPDSDKSSFKSSPEELFQMSPLQRSSSGGLPQVAPTKTVRRKSSPAIPQYMLPSSTSPAEQADLPETGLQNLPLALLKSPMTHAPLHINTPHSTFSASPLVKERDVQIIFSKEQLKTGLVSPQSSSSNQLFLSDRKSSSSLGVENAFTKKLSNPANRSKTLHSTMSRLRSIDDANSSEKGDKNLPSNNPQNPETIDGY